MGAALRTRAGAPGQDVVARTPRDRERPAPHEWRRARPVGLRAVVPGELGASRGAPNGLIRFGRCGAEASEASWSIPREKAARPSRSRVHGPDRRWPLICRQALAEPIQGRAVMAETPPTDVLVAGYQDIDEATKDFEALVALVKAKAGRDRGRDPRHACAGRERQRAADGRPPAAARVRAGAAASALAVGLFAPPLLASVAVGAVAGGVVGKFVDHRVEKEIHDKIGENLPPGSAGIIAVFDDEQRLGVEQALAGAPLRSVVQTDKQGIARAQGVAGRGDGEVQPGPHGAADPGPELRRARSAGRSTSRSPTGRST